MDRFWLPPDVSTHGFGVDQLINFLHYFMIVLFVAWGVFFVYCLVRFRQRRQPRANYTPVKGTVPKLGEVAVVLVEAVLLIGFSMPVWARTKERENFPKAEDALEVRVVAQQFAWNIHYPGADGVFGPRDPALTDKAENPIGLDRSHPTAKDDIVSVNVMHVPVDKPVIVRLSSLDVIHSFWIPMLRIKQDAVPGMTIPVWFEATKTSAALREDMIGSISLPAEGRSASRFLQRVKSHVAARDYGAAGDEVLAAGGAITEDVIPALRAAGISELEIAPREPVEIHCAQLCGLQHYSMRGFLVIDTQEKFDKWLEKQAEYLQDGEDDWGDDEWGDDDSEGEDA